MRQLDGKTSADCLHGKTSGSDHAAASPTIQAATMQAAPEEDA